MDEQTQGNQIRLVLVDDQGLFRTSLSRFLSTQPGLEVVGECGTTSEALAILSGTAVDIVLLDLDARADHGDELISAGRRAGYQCRFLIIGGVAEAKDLTGALKLGASGIFLKSEAPERLVQAIRLVATGAVWIEQKVMLLLANQLAGGTPFGDPGSGGPLTEREERVLLGILGGFTNRKIGDNLCLSESTVKSIVQQLFLRAGVRTRSQLVRMALEGSFGPVRDMGKRVRVGMPAAPPLAHNHPQTANRV